MVLLSLGMGGGGRGEVSTAKATRGEPSEKKEEKINFYKDNKKTSARVCTHHGPPTVVG